VPGWGARIESRHLRHLEKQVDTIQSEQLSYFSRLTSCTMLEAHGMQSFEFDELNTLSGSLL
jgi:hypothetical protein